jgi:hypothetical protein
MALEAPPTFVENLPKTAPFQKIHPPFSSQITISYDQSSMNFFYIFKSRYCSTFIISIVSNSLYLLFPVPPSASGLILLVFLLFPSQALPSLNCCLSVCLSVCLSYPITHNNLVVFFAYEAGLKAGHAQSGSLFLACLV